MADKLLKICFFALIMFHGTISSAQEPGDESEDGGLEDSDTPAPIDENLLVLSVAGISLAFYGLASRKKGMDI